MSGSGLAGQQIDIAQMLLTGKLLHPSSELETERWLKENSGARELYPTKEDISRYRLYGAAVTMYQNKNLIEKRVYDKVSNIFSSGSKIVIYDLTNMYFTGQMLGSKKGSNDWVHIPILNIPFFGSTILLVKKTFALPAFIF